MPAQPTVDDGGGGPERIGYLSLLRRPSEEGHPA